MSGFVPEKKTYVFSEKVVRVFRKTCTCFFENIYGRDSLEKKSWITGEITVMPLIMEKLIIEAWKLKIPILGVAHMIDDGPHLQGRVKADAFTIADGFEGRQ